MPTGPCDRRRRGLSPGQRLARSSRRLLGAGRSGTSSMHATIAQRRSAPYGRSSVELTARHRGTAQPLERPRPAAPYVARGERACKLAEALEVDLVLDGQLRPVFVSGLEPVDDLPREGPPLLGLLEQRASLRAQDLHGHVLLHPGLVDMIVTAVRRGILGRAVLCLEVALEPLLRLRQHPPDRVGRAADLHRLTEVGHWVLRLRVSATLLRKARRLKAFGPFGCKPRQAQTQQTERSAAIDGLRLVS